MANSTAADKRLSNLLHFNGRLQSRFHTHLFESSLKGHAVDHGGQHTHIITLSPIHSTTFRLYAPKNIATAYHYC